MEIEGMDKTTWTIRRLQPYKTKILKVDHRDNEFLILIFSEHAVKEITDILDSTNRKWSTITKQEAIKLVESDLCTNKNHVSIQLLYEGKTKEPEFRFFFCKNLDFIK